MNHMNSDPDAAENSASRPLQERKRWPSRIALGLGILLAVALIVGWFYRAELSAWLFSPDPRGRASGIGNPSWTEWTPGNDQIPGIDQASITCGLWSDGRMAFVVWTDVSGGSSAMLPPVTTKGEGFVFEGRHQGSDGRHIDCRCATKDGRAGTVTINDKTFDLAQGALFLVSTISGQTQVRQLERNTLKLKGEDLKELAKNDQEIRDFFVSFAKTK
ncbi:MAG TPA: hypothetical protein DDY78_12150 [Planctomycetales bacterium]|nr:hypothetical protein [Planctomycetales bacterium]